MQLVPLVLCIINLIMFGFAAGIVLTGLIFRYGTKIQAFAWGMIPALEPLTAAFFPVQVLPEPLRSIAYFFPATYVFEMARYAYNSNGVVEWDLVTKAFILNIIFCVLGWKIFMYLFNTSRKTGQFARNES
jgi:ABC-2 type transport system permease protein